MNAATMVLVALTVGQCPGGRCGAPSFAPQWEPAPFVWAQPAATPAAEERLHWRPLADGDQVGLYAGVRQLGVWSHSRQRYAQRLGPGQFGEWQEGAPIDPPPPPGGVSRTPAPKPPLPPTGVVVERISPVERVTANGRPVTNAEGRQLIEGGNGNLEDDSQRPFVTLVSPDQGARQQLLAAPPAGARVHAYDPGDPMVQGLGFTAGKVYVQRPGGEVLLSVAWDGTPATATAIAEAVRKADPNYRPERDPDGRRLFPWPKLPDLSEVSSMLGMLVIGLSCPLLFVVFVVILLVVVWPTRRG